MGTEPAAESSPSPAVPTGTCELAIVSFVCGVLFLLGITAILAVIFGHVALAKIRRSGGRLQGEGLAIGGMALGYAGLLFVIVFYSLLGFRH